MAIEAPLTTLGFSESERAVYADLLFVGRSTAPMIAKRLSMPRTTIYWLLEQLGERGVVSIERRKGVTHFSANHPDCLLRMVRHNREKQLARLNREEQAAQEVIDSVQSQIKKSRHSPTKLQFFEGKENIEAMLYDYLAAWQDSMSEVDHTWWGYQDPTFASEYIEWLRLTWKVRQPKEIDKILTNEAEIEQMLSKVAPFRGVRFIEPKFSTSMWIAGDYIVMIMTAEKPHYAMQLKNAAFASNIRTVFNLLWEELRKETK